MHFTKINIEGFRGIKNLELEDCKTINVIVGENDSGKTSVLEAIFLLSGISSDHKKLDSISYYLIKQDRGFKALFHNLKASNLLNIQVETNKSLCYQLQIKPNEINTNRPMEFGDSQPNVEVKSVNVYLTQSTLKSEPKEYCRLGLSSLDSLRGNGDSDDYLKRDKLIYILNKTKLSGTDEQHIAKIIEKNKQKELVKILQTVNKNICDICFLKHELYINIGIEQLIPLDFSGDAVKRILTLIFALYDAQGGILLIDEIETSFYFSVLKPLWKTIYKLANELKVQIFVTTHSMETLQYLAEVGRELGTDFQEAIRSYSIIKDNKGEAKAFKYGFKGFNFLLEQTIEVR